MSIYKEYLAGVVDEDEFRQATINEGREEQNADQEPSDEDYDITCGYSREDFWW